MTAPHPVPSGTPPERTGHNGERRPLRRLHEYKTRDRETLGHVARYESPEHGKETIPYFRRDGDRWAAGYSEGPRPLFGLESLPEPAPGALIVIAEGEKCTELYHALGIPAITSAGGAQAVSKADLSPLAEYRGARIEIHRDADEAGGRYAADWAARLRAMGFQDVRIAALPGLEEGGDVEQWLRPRVVADWDGFAPPPGPQFHLNKLRRDLLAESARVAVRAEVFAPAGAVEAGNGIEAVPLIPESVSPSAYPVEALGDLLSSLVREMVDVVQIPEAIAGQSLLAAASLAVQPHADVRPDGRTIPLSLFCMTVAYSGDRKSTADGIALAPHREREAGLRAEYAERSMQYEIALSAYDTASRKAKSGKAATREAIERALGELGSPPVAPLKPILLASDFTVEGIRRCLSEGLPSLGLFSDEGARLAGGHSMLPENLLRTLGSLTNLWDGAGENALRAGDGLSELHGKRVALHTMMQPTIAPRFFADPTVREQGFLWRCLPVWIEPRPLPRYRDGNVYESAAFAAYRERMLALLDRPLPAINEGRTLTPRPLRLHPCAADAYRTLHNRTADAASAEGHEDLRGYFARIGEQALRIAGTLAVFDDPDAAEIALAPMLRGIALADWYLAEMIRVMGRAHVDAEHAGAARLIDWIRRHPDHGPVFTLRALCQHAPRPRSADALRKLMAVAERHGQIARLPGREAWRLSPEIEK